MNITAFAEGTPYNLLRAQSVHRPRRCSARAKFSGVVLEPVSSSSENLERLGETSVAPASTSGRSLVPGHASFLEFPAQRVSKEGQGPPLVRVRLSVHYRVHSRQLLCIGGSQIPFGWSFLSIAKVPMEWNSGDVWTCEVEIPAGTRIEYKYVILEEQDWTQQVSDDEGIVTFEYRTQPEGPPDVQQIQKQMAIVAWQPGPNRYVQVPSQEELDSLQPGEVREREPARAPQQNQISRTYGQQAKGSQPPNLSDLSLPLLARVAIANRGQRIGGGSRDRDEMAGTYESLSLGPDGVPLLERRDVWGVSRDSWEDTDQGRIQDP